MLTKKIYKSVLKLVIEQRHQRESISRAKIHRFSHQTCEN